MKKLLQINTIVNITSTGRIVKELGQIAMANGWESFIASARYDDQPSQSKFIKIGNRWDFIKHAIITRVFDRHGLGSKKVTQELIGKIKQITPDIIHLHNLHGYYLNIEVLFRFLGENHIPVVWTFHDCWPFTGHCTYFDLAGCEKWKIECSDCPNKKEYPASLIFDRSKMNYNFKKDLFTSLNRLTIVPVSEWLGRIVKQSFFAYYPIVVINNGIDTKIFTNLQDSSIRDKYKLHGKFIILGIAYIWNPRKGLEDFIKLSEKLDDTYQIILIGLTSVQIRNLPRQILGFLRTGSTHELAKFYNAADVYVNPTWEDNFPTTNLESLACGVPVVTYNTGGSVEAIDANTGMIVEKGDIEGLVTAIELIRSKRTEFNSESCIERVNKLFKKEDRYQDYINLYNSLLNTY